LSFDALSGRRRRRIDFEELKCLSAESKEEEEETMQTNVC